MPAHDPLRSGRRRVGWLTAALALAGLPALGWVSTLPGELDVRIIVLVGGLFLVGELLTIDVEFRHESQLITFISIPLVVGMLTLPPVLVVGLRLVTLIAVLAFVQRQPSFKLAFNASSALLDLCVVAFLIHQFVPPGQLGPRSWVIVFVAVVAADAFGALTTTAAISAFQGRLEPVGLTEFLMTAAVALADVVISVVLVTLLQADDPAWVLVLAIAAFVVVLSRAFARVTHRYRSLQLLDRYTRALGASVVESSVTRRLLSESAEILHAERAWLIERSSSGLRRHALIGHDTAEVTDGTPLDERLLAELGDTAELLDEDGPLGPELEAAGLTEVIAGRLAAPDGAELALAVAERSGEVRPFDANDVTLFDTLAVHAGLALQNRDLVDRLREEIESTEYLANHDVLTGLPNRMLFSAELDAALRAGDDVAVLLVDLDRFKEVNDTLGHHNGDLLLIEVGRRLAAVVGPGITVARLGGDEFALLLPGAGEADAVATARELVTQLERPFDVEDVALDVTGSVGVALRSRLAGDGATLLRQADVAMYLAKESHSVVEVYRPEIDHYSPQRLMLVGRLRTAIDERALTLHYQPQIDLASGEVLGVEALIRWPQPGRPPIPPDEFIYIAEHTGLIHPLTQFVLEEAVGRAAEWFHAGQALRMSVNLSASNLTRPEIVDDLAALLERTGLPPQLLVAELTETAAMENPARSASVMQALRDLGVLIAIDDFGTGHSSLSYLTGLPADELKIDQSFVFAMGTDPAADTIVRAIIDLGHSLGLEIVAEGVETEAQAAALTRLGCAIGQGYLFSRPLEPRGLDLWLEQHQPDPVGPRPRPSGRRTPKLRPVS